ncbi:unnamed protein product [Penicillium glandicola]
MNMTSILGPPPPGINLAESRDAQDNATVATILFTYILVYLVELLLIKSSILMFYRRIFGMNWMIWATLFISYSWCIASMIAALSACDPISYFWTELTDPASGSYRYDFYYYYLGNAAANVVTDVLILLVPMPIIWRLQMRRAQKIAVCFILLLGGFVCIASGVRIHYITHLKGNVDITWALGSVSVWSIVEPSIGIICACLPVIQPFIRAMARKVPNLPGTRQNETHPLSGFTERASVHERKSSRYNMECRTIPTAGDSTEDLNPLSTARTRVQIETDSKQRDSVDESLNPMAIRVERVVQWRVD